MLNLCGAKWTPRFVDFFNGETRTAEYRAKVNEMGEVPVLEHAGKRLSQSGVILHYLADHFRKFQGEKLETLRWLLWDNHKLTSYIATLRYFMVTFVKTGETAGHRVPARTHQGLARDPRPAPEEAAVHRRRPALDRRFLRVRLSVLARRVRRELDGVPGDRRLARAHQGPAGLGASLRADARPPAAGEEDMTSRSTSSARRQFHVEDEPVDISIYGWEDWVTLRPVLDDGGGGVLPGVHALRAERLGRLDRGDRALLPGGGGVHRRRRCRCARTTTSRSTSSTA